MEPLGDGSLRAVLERIKATTLVQNREAFAELLHVTTANAKRHVREGGAHAWHTPTPAHKGGGPAVVSGDLSRAIAETPIGETAGTLTARVEVRNTPHRTAPRKTVRARGMRAGKGQRSSGEIGEILETKKDFPFMAPAADDVRGVAEAIVRAHVRGV